LRRIAAIAAALALGGAGALLAAWPGGRAHPVIFADAQDDAAVSRGAVVYGERCGDCHGRRMQGQALWQLDDADASRRAPALDATGPAWTRPDAVLFRIVSQGEGTAMPGFASRLTQADRLAVIAFVKSRWPVALRAGQAARNPGQAGMPKQGAAWSFVAFCRTRLLD
jgi:mono/diheme cytochrome c family protein